VDSRIGIRSIEYNLSRKDWKVGLDTLGGEKALGRHASSVQNPNRQDNVKSDYWFRMAAEGEVRTRQPLGLTNFVKYGTE
jgi:hypothetical protein